MCQQGGWAPNGVDTRRRASEDAGPQRRWIGGSHTDWRGERVPERMLDLEGGGLWDPTSVEEGNEAFFIRVWKPLPNRPVLKTLREVRKEKTKKGQYLLAVDLGCYINVSRELYICRHHHFIRYSPSNLPLSLADLPYLTNREMMPCSSWRRVEQALA